MLSYPSRLVRGTKYKIRYRSETQRYDREAVMIYLDKEPAKTSTIWSARPTAGTQELPNSWVISVEEIDDPFLVPYLNRRAE